MILREKVPGDTPAQPLGGSHSLPLLAIPWRHLLDTNPGYERRGAAPPRPGDQGQALHSGSRSPGPRTLPSLTAVPGPRARGWGDRNAGTMVPERPARACRSCPGTGLCQAV